jgi:hypothetical protein
MRERMGRNSGCPSPKLHPHQKIVQLTSMSPIVDVRVADKSDKEIRFARGLAVAQCDGAHRSYVAGKKQASNSLASLPDNILAHDRAVEDYDARNERGRVKP